MLETYTSSPSSPRSSSSELLFGIELLVRRFYHLVLLRQVDPKLQAARFGLSGFVDRHFGVDDCKEWRHLARWTTPTHRKVLTSAAL